MECILYSTGCPRCQVLEKKLEAKGIEYEEFTDSDKMVEMGLTAIPMLKVDGHMMDFMEAVRWIENADDFNSDGCAECSLN